MIELPTFPFCLKRLFNGKNQPFSIHFHQDHDKPTPLQSYFRSGVLAFMGFLMPISRKNRSHRGVCLPPIIRHIALSALYDDDPSNPDIVDKLVLAKLKAFDKDTADAWVEAHKESLLSMSVVADSDYLKKLIAAVGEEAAVSLVAAMPDNMYHTCKEKIQTVDVVH